MFTEAPSSAFIPGGGGLLKDAYVFPLAPIGRSRRTADPWRPARTFTGPKRTGLNAGQ